MSASLTYEIPFDKAIFEQQCELKFDLIWEEGLRRNKIKLWLGIIGLVLGSAVIYSGDMIGSIFIFIGVLNLILYYDYFSRYRKNERRYFRIIQRESKKMQTLKDVSIWEFDKDYFRYKFYKFDAKFNWVAFGGFRIIQDNLFLDFEEQQKSYILGRTEVGQEHFDVILSFLNEIFPQST